METLDAKNYGYGFVPEEFLPPGKDEYWLRNIQAQSLLGKMPRRNLDSREIAALEQNGCRSGNWNDVLVSDPFDPALVQNATFYGLVRLGRIESRLLRHHDFCVPCGIRNSTLISCDTGDDVSIQDCSLVSHYIIACQCILSRVDELVCTNHAKFGNGIIKDGEAEDLRVWIDVMNEAGGRSILPFALMIPADAYLWAAWRDDTALALKLREITQATQAFLHCEASGKNQCSPPEAAGACSSTQLPLIESAAPQRRGFYGTIGKGTVLKSCKIIKDTAVGETAYIKGANKLKNLSILSSEDEATQIGEGVELVNGIVGYGCHIFYGSKAVRFVLGRCCSLKYGARLIHSVLGDNSTVSCCEILNNLVFPVHEQHHNNSFLIASLIKGMSNMAAGATVGSNHNSRSNDGEIQAGRGFWPGLSVTLKHSSRFASFCLIVKGNYPYELNIPLPFSLVNNNVRLDRLEVMPAYFWMYNLYALERNSWKTGNRDRRIKKVQHIEADYLAPDTAEEIIRALELMEGWMAASGMDKRKDNELQGCAGTELKSASDEDPEYDYSPAEEDEVLFADGLERHNRRMVLLKPQRAAAAYREMLFFYGMKTIVHYLEKQCPEKMTFEEATALLNKAALLNKTEDENHAEQNCSLFERRIKDWENLGGQIAPVFRLDTLRKNIREGTITSWEEIHAEYDAMAVSYDMDKAYHAWAVLSHVCDQSNTELSADKTAGGLQKNHPLAKPELFMAALEKTLEISAWIKEQVYISKAKDYHDPFRSITFRNKAEMEEVIGKAENNSFIRLAEEKHRSFTAQIHAVKAKYLT